jgi:hypothetical protein
VLKHFGLTAEQALKLRADRKKRLIKEAMEKKYSKTAEQFVIEEIQKDSMMSYVLKNKKLKERMEKEK